MGLMQYTTSVAPAQPRHPRSLVKVCIAPAQPRHPRSLVKMILVTVMIAGFVCCACTLNQRSSGSGHVFDDSPQARAMFRKADRDQNEYLTYGEFQNVFRSYDNNTDGLVTSAEFLEHWQDEMNGTVTQGLHVFTILDVDKDFILEITAEIPHIYHWFDFNSDWKVTEGEFVVQWVKIST
ncbi:uncharacterized protein LOC127848237 isoform X3 [Dreissena polymorpha]|uniref:uncharacterized protein LOC127848237 isoform X3 n=1 Tax=Dreissena polymorpha TaxID=45954 RepID=UPI0022656440|nr:uncharacterized protein LOC127848237 isoform X3 [Dreissena polymorpha]